MIAYLGIKVVIVNFIVFKRDTPPPQATAQWKILAILALTKSRFYTNFGPKKVDFLNFGAIFGEFSNIGAKFFMRQKVGILPTVRYRL